MMSHLVTANLMIVSQIRLLTFPIWSASHEEYMQNKNHFPEFQQLMQIVKTDLVVKLERIREMERKGDLASAPVVEVDP